MKYNNLHLKWALCSALLVLLLYVEGTTNAFAATQYDFSAVAPSGQTMYYKITSNTSTSRTVKVTHPYSGTTRPWDHTTQPTGALTIPYYVEYNGYSYSVTAIDDYAFGTDTPYSYYNEYFSCTGLTSIVIPSSVTSIGQCAFCQCIGITVVTIPTSVTSISSKVFYNCTNLVTVNFNATNCSSVGTDTWTACTKFTTLNLGNTVTRIPTNGFQGATQLASVTISKKVHTIGDYAFNGCTNLTNVTIANNSVLNSIGQYAFQNCSKLATINLPNTLASIGNYAFNGCSLLQSTTELQLLPNALETIGDYAFQNASTLAYIHIPSTVTSIGKYAFKSCTALNTVDFEATNCTYSGTQAEPPFFYCSGLSTVNVSDNVTIISAYCFKDCTSLTNLTLRNGLSEIGTYAFYSCMNISSLILPTSVTCIGSFAFGNAYDMQIANVESHNPIPPTIGEEAVFPAGQTIYVPYASLNDYESAEYWEDYFFEGMAVKTVSGYGTSTESDKWAFIASPLSANTAPTATAIEGLIAATATEYDLYRFNQDANGLEWQNYKAHTGDFVFENGQGYLYASKADANIMFKGDFNEGTSMDVDLDYTEGKPLAGWNLVGNPFPYPATVSRSYYVMNDGGTGLNPVALSSGTSIEACTGVVVKATAMGQKVTFTKPSKTTKENNGLLYIDLVNEDKVIVSFNDGDELGKYYFGEQNANIYIPKNGKEYAIAYCDKQGEMPLNFKAAKNGEYTITVGPENVELNYLHLIDNMTGADVDLLASPEYTFTAKTNDYASRFRLVFSPTGIEEYDAENGFAYFNGSEWVVANGENATLQVVDVMGRIVYCTDVARNVCTSGMPAGVYVLRLINGDDVKTQKIVIP